VAEFVTLSRRSSLKRIPAISPVEGELIRGGARSVDEVKKGNGIPQETRCEKGFSHQRKREKRCEKGFSHERQFRILAPAVFPEEAGARENPTRLFLIPLP